MTLRERKDLPWVLAGAVVVIALIIAGAVFGWR
jgi:hypothetical protein